MSRDGQGREQSQNCFMRSSGDRAVAESCREIAMSLFWGGMKLPERSETPADHPFAGRRPTSHERMTGLPWDASYHQSSPAPWDIGHPQPAIVRLASAGGLAGPVLDAGCGTGENTLYLASLGLSVLGVDVAETALSLARGKARERRIEAEFATADAFHLELFGAADFRRCLTVDCSTPSTPKSGQEYVASLASVTEPGGTLYVLCFSDEGPDIGPHPVSEQELRAAFTPSTGWKIASIEADRVQTRFHGDNGAPAWLAAINRI